MSTGKHCIACLKRMLSCVQIPEVRTPHLGKTSVSLKEYESEQGSMKLQTSLNLSQNAN